MNLIRHRPEPRLDDLGELTLFERCTPQQRQWIRTVSTLLQLDEGHVLCEAGAFGREVFVILDGEVEVRNGDDVWAVLGPGETVGEISLLDRGPRTATVVARTPVQALVMDKREFTSVLQQVPSVAQALLAATAARLRSADAER